jgi:hypothetical protein
VTALYRCGKPVGKINDSFGDTISVMSLLLSMQTIELTSACVCASHDSPQRDYVFYTGSVAGVSDTQSLESHTKTVERSSDEVELERHRVNGR